MYERAYRDSVVHRRQAELHAQYDQHPEAARIVKRVRSGPGDGRDPFHGTVAPENVADPDAPYGVVWRYGIDRAVGGLHDAPNPGELLCGALAACADGTARMIAERLGIELEDLEVEVSGELDVRGTLAIDRAVPVGFQRLATALRVRPAPGTSPRLLEQLAAATEQLCVVLDTVRRGVAVDVTFEVTHDEGRLTCHSSR
jgi:uncharacterized OsmC-like protein